MSHPQFDRSKLRIKPLSDRRNKTIIERDQIAPETPARPVPGAAEVIERIRAARVAGRPVMLAFGAHTIKNCLAPVLIRLLERGWITHLATNGAGIIHDWEFAFQGQSSEDVRRYVAEGQFGIWQETGFNINLALVVGASEGKGYGESVGALIENEGLTIPPVSALTGSAAALDLAETVTRFQLPPGFRRVPHPYKKFSVQAAAYRRGVPFTGHPMFGHDIIYTHPASCGAAIGRCAERDFLAFAHNVAQLDGGVYLSVGSAVMSPMVFEKSLSMVNNLRGQPLTTHFMAVVDLAEAPWDWQRDGEPPPENPAYYLRYCKTFSRMGGTLRYLSADNRDFLLTLAQSLG
ncbi:MAG: hypothetical protein PCFJNLEI_00480 [Verrucomicrobiae bacterium]|nr:hypothetical protein [Verrucomicrobiae bacterium]